MMAAKPAKAVAEPAAPNALITNSMNSANGANALAYESVFARYLSHRDEKVGSWRDVNATVDRIGGWRAYAKEAQQADAPSAAPSVPALPALPALLDKSIKPVEPAKPNPHAGHGVKP